MWTEVIHVRLFLGTFDKGFIQGPCSALGFSMAVSCCLAYIIFLNAASIFFSTQYLVCGGHNAQCYKFLLLRQVRQDKTTQRYFPLPLRPSNCLRSSVMMSLDSLSTWQWLEVRHGRLKVRRGRL